MNLHVSKIALAILITTAIMALLGYFHNHFRPRILEHRVEISPLKNGSMSLAPTVYRVTNSGNNALQAVNNTESFTGSEIFSLQLRGYEPAYDYYDNEILQAMAETGDGLALLALARKLAYREPLAAVEYDFMALVNGEPTAAEHAARIYRGLASRRIGISAGNAENVVDSTDPNRYELINSYAWGLVGQLYGNADSGLINAGLQRQVLFDDDEIAVACDFARVIYAQVELSRLKDGRYQRADEALITSYDLSRGTRECPKPIASSRYECQRRTGTTPNQSLDAFVCRTVY